MTFEPSSTSTILFSSVVLLNTVLIALGFWRALDRRHATLAIGALVAWLAIHAGIAMSGVLESNEPFPRVAPYLVTQILFAAWLVFKTEVGRRLSELPTFLLIGFQGFRLPLEVVLHRLMEEDALPIQMTWSGLNFDVLTGVTALLFALTVWKKEPPKALIWVWNVLGFALLITVVTIALLSSPIPIRQFMNDPPVLLVFHVPYTWIVSVCVLSALIGHLLLFKKLLRGQNV